MNRQGFIIDLNRCTGCHACVLACMIENDGAQEMPWREIFSSVPPQVTNLPVYHYSLACNHCQDAPCKPACPAEAFKRDRETGAIMHLEQECLGCRYCTWACPYEAPKWNPHKKVIEKCTFCLTRQEIEQEPACTMMCPTGALGFGPVEVGMQSGPGFLDHGVNPAVSIIPLRRDKGPETHIPFQPEPPAQIVRSGKHMGIETEWPLALFTFINALMFGLVVGAMAGVFVIPGWIFPVLGIMAGTISFFHLGKKERAWKAVRHVKDSWLSREIVLFGLFMFSGTLFFFMRTLTWSGYAAIVLGLATLFSIDRVYDPVRNLANRHFHSADTVLTGALFAALLMNRPMLIILLLLIKMAFYLHRKYISAHAQKHIHLPGMLRLLLGFITPMVVLYFNLPLSYEMVVILILFSEVEDRIEFYEELRIKKVGTQFDS